MIMSKTYSGMLMSRTFEERFEYLSLDGRVGKQTFGFERWLNQSFYTSREWRQVRHQIIARDEGCDLGVRGYEIHDKIIIHHIVPMTVDDFEDGNPMMLNPNNLITTSHNTHNAIHYGDASLLIQLPKERTPGDTKLW